MIPFSALKCACVSALRVTRANAATQGATREVFGRPLQSAFGMFELVRDCNGVFLCIRFGQSQLFRVAQR